MTNTISSNPSGYQPQSRDTSSKVDRFLTLAFRRMPACKKVLLIKEATKGIQQWALIGIRNQHPDATPAEVKFQLVVKWLIISLSLSRHSHLQAQSR